RVVAALYPYPYMASWLCAKKMIRLRSGLRRTFGFILAVFLQSHDGYLREPPRFSWRVFYL
ncbi:hypothetical protein, partial [Escherichia coli]|uniref:hypothetical protein n=1 Tax=Escherichia coli TaxID=562 RepID=UPI001BC8A1B5